MIHKHAAITCHGVPEAHLDLLFGGCTGALAAVHMTQIYTISAVTVNVSVVPPVQLFDVMVPPALLPVHLLIHHVQCHTCQLTQLVSSQQLSYRLHAQTDSVAVAKHSKSCRCGATDSTAL